MEATTISIESFEELCDKMTSMEFYVNWCVTSEIGPDWIGSYRTIDFHLDNLVLTETKFVEKLKENLIELIPIPSESKDHVITGQGDITLKDSQLEVYYDWAAAIPYQNASEYKEDKIVFYP